MTEIGYSLSTLLDRATKHDRTISHPYLTFGLDLRVFALAEEEFGPSRTRKLFYRPALEPILVSFWSEITSLDFEGTRALEIASLLSGKRQSIRSCPIEGRAPDGSTFRFSDTPAADWLQKIKKIESTMNCPVEAAAFRYYSTIWEHPFLDGNGRFARTLLIGALSKWGIITQPSLGLSGAMEYMSNEITFSFRKSHEAGELSDLSSSICRAISLSLHFLYPY